MIEQVPIWGYNSTTLQYKNYSNSIVKTHNIPTSKLNKTAKITPILHRTFLCEYLIFIHKPTTLSPLSKISQFFHILIIALVMSTAVSVRFFVCFQPQTVIHILKELSFFIIILVYTRGRGI